MTLPASLPQVVSGCQPTEAKAEPDGCSSLPADVCPKPPAVTGAAATYNTAAAGGDCPVPAPPPWLCTPCSVAGHSDCDTQCVLCPIKGGALKPVDGDLPASVAPAAAGAAEAGAVASPASAPVTAGSQFSPATASTGASPVNVHQADVSHTALFTATEVALEATQPALPGTSPTALQPAAGSGLPGNVSRPSDAQPGMEGVPNAPAVDRSPPGDVFTAGDTSEGDSKERTRFAHLFCCQWVPETYVGDADIMQPICGVGSVSKERWRMTCGLCRKREGACIQCSHGERDRVTARHAERAIYMQCSHGNHSWKRAVCGKRVGGFAEGSRAECCTHLCPIGRPLQYGFASQ